LLIIFLSCLITNMSSTYSNNIMEFSYPYLLM
jgi:hypothetical protein